METDSVNKQIDLTGQVAIVTGGGRGIGRAISLALAQAAGAAVAVVARSTDQLAQTVALVEEMGGRAIAITTDVTDQQATEQMVHEVEQQLGPVDLLVNNAGVPGPGGPLWEVDPDDWWRCMDVNLRGPYLCSRAPYMAAYAISKCAVMRFSEILAAEIKDHCIHSFAIAPGFVRTAMTEAAAASPADEKWLGGVFTNSFAAGYDVPPERAADLVAFLASGKADALSGCYISVDDDLAELVRRAEEIQRDDLHTLRLRT